jgi:hypothetical protein
MEKVALFVFRGDFMCFIHVLLNSLDMHKKNYEVKIILEGESTKLVPELIDEKKPLKKMWDEVIEKGLVEGVCKGCASKMGTIKDAEKQNLKLLGDMNGHPSISQYMDKGFRIITF